jgi:hypothetical protein
MVNLTQGNFICLGGVMKLLTLNDKTMWDESINSGCRRIRFNAGMRKWIVLDVDPCPKCPDGRCENAGNPMRDPEHTIIINTKKEDGINEMVQS